VPCSIDTQEGLDFADVHGLFMYDTDLTDPQWLMISSFLPKPLTGGRPRTTDEREVVNAIFYFLKTGCQWRLLPSDFPPWQTVYRYFIDWRKQRVWKLAWSRVETQFRLRSWLIASQ
jgi:putative transposase